MTASGVMKIEDKRIFEYVFVPYRFDNSGMLLPAFTLTVFYFFSALLLRVNSLSVVNCIRLTGSFWWKIAPRMHYRWSAYSHD